MREIRPSGSEGGVAPTRHPDPYRAGERVGCGLGAEEQVLEAVERGVGVLYLGEEVVHLLDGVFGLVRARGRGRDACPTARRRDARATARRRDACATAVADGLEGGGDVADVAPGEGFDAEIKEAVEFVERDAELEGDPGSGQASAAGLLPDGQAVEVEPADDWGVDS